jgi:hypothetical protein
VGTLLDQVLAHDEQPAAGLLGEAGGELGV